jgi:hypothetical protein
MCILSLFVHDTPRFANSNLGNLIKSSGRIATPPLPQEGDFLFSPLFSGLIQTLQGNTLLGELFLLEQNDKPMRLPPSTLPTPPAIAHVAMRLHAQWSYPIPPCLA